jgi:non-specific serine/threonine protein kinase
MRETDPAKLLTFEAFGDMLKYLRRRAGLTQRELSIAVGYSEAQISRLERNERLPDVATLAALFIPALHLQDEPQLVGRLLELAAAARGESLPRSGSITVTQVVEHDVTDAADETEIESPSAALNNLPLQLTSFVGRERETNEVCALLAGASSQPARLATLIGAGGCGKTRLALHAAERLLARDSVARDPAPFPDGIWLIELASLSDGASVPQAAATALGVKQAEQPDLTSALVDHLRSKRALLLLDNCEHVVRAAAALAETLLRNCSHLHILATSRAPLGVAGETTYRVPSLSLPLPDTREDSQVRMRYESIQLFVERARNALPNYRLTAENADAIVEICRRLDGIPLAIELAAARIRLLNTHQIAGRLDDAFRLLSGGSSTALPRHRTLRAAIEWSYHLLSEAERALFRRLSVFAGGWTLDAAEAVNDGDASTLDLLSSLVDQSLVTLSDPRQTQGGDLEGEVRYRLLETVRQYAHEQLTHSGEENEIRERHWRYFNRLVEETESKLKGRDQAQSFTRLDQELDNLRSALDYALNHHAEAGLSMLLALSRFWRVRGYLEASVWLFKFLAAPDLPARSLARALALAESAFFIQDTEEAQRRCDESLALCEAMNDRAGVAHTYFVRGQIHWWREPDAARPAFQRSLQLYRELGDDWHAAEVLVELGEFEQVHGAHRSLARAYMEESLHLFRQLGDRIGMAAALVHLGDVAVEQGDLDAMQIYGEEGLALARELGDRYNISWGLSDLASAALGRGEYDKAIALFQQASDANEASSQTDMVVLRRHWMAHALRLKGDLAEAKRIFEHNLRLSKERDLAWGVAGAHFGLGEVARAQGEVTTALHHHRASLEGFRAIDQRWMIAYSLEAFASLAFMQAQAQSDIGLMQRAARLFGAADALRAAIGTKPLPVEQAERDRNASAVRDTLGAAAFESAYAEGRALELLAAIDYALE